MSGGIGLTNSLQLRGMPNAMTDSFNVHCVKSVRIRSYFSWNTGKYGPEITPNLDTFHAVEPLSSQIKINAFASKDVNDLVPSF